jgi:hypothetical protein
MPMSLHSPKQQWDVALKVYVSSVSDVFGGMFQVFHTNVAKVDRGCCNGCTRMLQVFVPNILFVLSNICCKCVYLDAAYVSLICCNLLSGFCVCLQWFSSVFRCFFCKCFKSMFQVFHLSLDICSNCCICMFQKKIGCLHMLQCHPPVAAARGGARGQAGRRRYVGSGWAQMPCRVDVGAKCRCGRPHVRVRLNVRTLALSWVIRPIMPSTVYNNQIIL